MTVSQCLTLATGPGRPAAQCVAARREQEVYTVGYRYIYALSVHGIRWDIDTYIYTVYTINTVDTVGYIYIWSIRWDIFKYINGLYVLYREIWIYIYTLQCKEYSKTVE